MWDRVFELILRLKGNAVIVGTAAYPDERSMQLATRRGLYLAEHHITLLGTNTFQWPTGVPYSFAKSRETLEYTWRAVVEQQKEKKMLWTVGYRGLNDYPFWLDDTRCVSGVCACACVCALSVPVSDCISALALQRTRRVGS